VLLRASDVFLTGDKLFLEVAMLESRGGIAFYEINVKMALVRNELTRRLHCS
jgi:hypothetical protein